MKSTLYFLAFVLISVAVSAQHAPVNPNGGFEQSTLGPFTSAAATPGFNFDGTEANVTWSIVNTPGNFVSGQALQATVNAIAPAGNDWDIQFRAIDVNTDSGKVYRFTAWAKASDARANTSFTGSRGEAHGWDEVFRMGGTPGRVPLSTEWQRFETIFFTYWRENEPDMMLAPMHQATDRNDSLINVLNSGPLTFWYDEIHIIQAGTASATVVPAGNELILNMGYPIDPESAIMPTTANFFVTAGIEDIPVTEVVVDSLLIILKLGAVVPQGVNVLVEYNGLSEMEYAAVPKNYLSDVAGTAQVRAFTDPVENRSTQIVGILNPEVALNVAMWPNPVGDANVLNIDGIAQVSRIDIVSITGQVIKSVENNGNLARIDVSGLDKGIYVVVLRSGDRPVRALRFVK